MIVRPIAPLPRFIAGVDAAFATTAGQVVAAAVVYDRIARQVIEVASATRPLDVPYVPTFLSFREGPAVMAALAQLRHRFEAICFDGQGYAHPRRCGLATHVSVLLDMPGIGCAKSRLIGTHAEPGEAAGDGAPLMDKQEQIGLVLRTRTGVKPIYVSVGHRVDLPTAAELLLVCCDRYRIPEPTRQADIEVARAKQALLQR